MNGLLWPFLDAKMLLPFLARIKGINTQETRRKKEKASSLISLCFSTLSFPLLD